MNSTVETGGDVRREYEGFYVSAEQGEGVVRGSFCLPEMTSAARYLKMLDNLQVALAVAPEPLRFAETGAVAEKPPFLSVIMRTQGRRIEELTDVFLCLGAQTDDDFELMVMGHKVDEALLPDLLNLIDSLPAKLRGKIAYYPIDGGTRTTPLQVGFSVARGEYVAVLDDDDLVMDTWVSTFRELARDNPGKMLHSYVVTQDWSAHEVEGEPNHRRLRAERTFGPSYCHSFDAAAQFSENACPLMGLAFPRFVLQELGLNFDESLTTMEDWDFLMRVYGICGVASAERVCAIYRLWTNTETSHTLHDAHEWDRNYARIVDKMNARPVLLDVGDVDDVREKNLTSVTSRNMLVRSAGLLVFSECEKKGQVEKDIKSFHDAELSKLGASCLSAGLGQDGWDIVFNFENAAPVAMVALTPLSAAFKVMGEFKMRLTESNGNQTVLDFADRAFDNGYQVDCNHIVYLKCNPYVAFELPRVMSLSRVEFAFRLLSNVPDFYIDQVTLGKRGLMFGRASRWFKRKVLHDE